MFNARSIFLASVAESRQSTVLYDYLNRQIRVPVSYDDLLRGQVVIVVAAFDKLIHDLIRIGMCQIFSGLRPVTPKYQCEKITIQMHSDLVAASLPPKEFIFEKAISEKLALLSFQKHDKIADGLSLIWNENYKWNKIGGVMGETGPFVSKKISLIANRRNSIVHESDMNPLTNYKTPIDRSECADITNFIESCGKAIVDCVLL